MATLSRHSALAVLMWAIVATASGAAPAAGAAGPAGAPAESDWRTPDPQNVLVIETSKGRILLEMQPQVAPQHVARVRQLARQGFYDGQSFFRVIDEFMDQTGDPQNTGVGGSTLPNLAPEFTFRRGSDMAVTVVNREDGRESGLLGAMPIISQPLDLAPLMADHRVRAYGTFCGGVAGMARAGPPDSANSQFFLMRATGVELDQKYTPWGRVIAGQDVVRAIKTGEPPPPPADKMTSVRILADLPPSARPRVRIIDTASPWFSAYMARTRADKGLSFSVCDLDLPSDVK